MTGNYRKIIPEFNYFYDHFKKEKKAREKYDLTFVDGLVFSTWFAKERRGYVDSCSLQFPLYYKSLTLPLAGWPISASFSTQQCS